jgi:hypothetical protein
MVEDNLYVLTGAAHCLSVSHVAVNPLSSGEHIGDALAGASGAVVEDAHTFATLDQLTDEV